MLSGNYAASAVIYGKFTTYDGTGVPATLSGTPALSVYKDDDATQSTAGITLTADFDSITGLNQVKIDTSADGTFYAAGHDFDVVITTGTVDGVSVVGTVVGRFSLVHEVATLANGVTHGGNTTTLSLRNVTISSSIGTAVTITSSAGVGVQVNSTFAGSYGVLISGPTGAWITSTSTIGLLVQGASGNPAVKLGSSGSGGGVGLRIEGGTGNASSNAAVEFAGIGSGAGALIAGGNTGIGLEIDVGASAQAALYLGGDGTNPDVLLAGTGLLQADLGGRILGNTSTTFAGIGALVNVSGTPNVNVSSYSAGQDPATLVSAISVAGQTLVNALRYIGANTTGKIAGAGSGTETFRDFAGIVAVTETVDSLGNRTNVVYS